MITILIGIVIGIAIAIYNTYSSYWRSSIVEYIINSIIGVVVGFFIGLAVAFMIPMKTYIKNYSLKIESLQDNNGFGGRFFLGSGQVDGKMKYVFYYEENGLYKMEQIDYDLVRIRYSDGIPKVNVGELSFTESTINYFALDSDIGYKSYIIEVPKGSIKNNYNLDAQ